MRLILALHVFFMVCWSAGIFYLPRLFVYHAMSEDSISQERFKIMERKLYYGIMTPSAILTIIFGIWLLSFNFSNYMHMGWLHAKLALMAILIAFHLYCGKLYRNFKDNRNQHSHLFFRWLNELPVVLLAGIIILVIVQPF